VAQKSHEEMFNIPAHKGYQNQDSRFSLILLEWLPSRTQTPKNVEHVEKGTSYKVGGNVN
jgi:hypothetical protein